MPRGTLMEYCPLQILSYEDVGKLVDCVLKELQHKGGISNLPAAARPAWDQVAEMVRQALLDARLFGSEKARERITAIDNELLQYQTTLSEDDYRALQIVYMDYLDSLYGAILHHTLSHLPLSVMMPMAQLRLYRVSLWRYAMVRNAAEQSTQKKGALEQVVELMYSGGGRFELDFEVKMLGE